jgi:hypothetical protein
MCESEIKPHRTSLTKQAATDEISDFQARFPARKAAFIPPNREAHHVAAQLDPSCAHDPMQMHAVPASASTDTTLHAGFAICPGSKPLTNKKTPFFYFTR